MKILKHVQNKTFAKGTLTKRVYLRPKMQMQNYITFVMINMDINCFLEDEDIVNKEVKEDENNENQTEYTE